MAFAQRKPLQRRRLVEIRRPKIEVPIYKPVIPRCRFHWIWDRELIPAMAAIAAVSGQVASAVSSGGGTTVNAVLPNNPTPGNFVVACVGTPNTSITITSVKDSNNNSYTATTSSPFAGSAANTAMGIYYLPNAPTNATKTITFTYNTSSTFCVILVAEFSGVLPTSPLETDATNNHAATSTTINLPSITTTNAGDLLIGFAMAGQTISTANSPWTGIDVVQNGNYAEYLIQSAPGAQAINFTQAPTGGWTAMEAAFKAASKIPYTPWPLQMPLLAQ